MKSEFQYRLLKAIGEKQISAAELSRISGVNKVAISNYINGVYIPKQDKCYALATALGVDPGWLMTGEEPRKIIHEKEEEPPTTAEARILAKGIDKMPQVQREAIMNLMIGLYPGIFEKENHDDT